MNAIAIELSAEDRAALHRLTLALEALASPQPTQATQPSPGTAAKVASVAERIQEAMLATGKKQADLVRETDINKGVISRYISGEVEPRHNAAHLLARALGVTEMWLWGYDVPSGLASKDTDTPEFLDKQMNLPKEEPAPVAEEKQPAQESKPAVTLEQLQALAQELLAPGSGKSAAVRKLIKSHAERISLIPQDKWAEVYDALTAMKEGQA